MIAEVREGGGGPSIYRSIIVSRGDKLPVLTVRNHVDPLYHSKDRSAGTPIANDTNQP